MVCPDTEDKSDISGPWRNTSKKVTSPAGPPLTATLLQTEQQEKLTHGPSHGPATGRNTYSDPLLLLPARPVLV